MDRTESFYLSSASSILAASSKCDKMQSTPKTHEHPSQEPSEFLLIHWPFPTYKGVCILKQKKVLTKEIKQRTKEAMQETHDSIALF